MITVAIRLQDVLVLATDRTLEATAVGLPADVNRMVELEPGFVVAVSGIWATEDRSITASQDVVMAFQPHDTAESFLQRYDRLHRPNLERFLTKRFQESPATALRECFCPLVPPQSLVIGEVGRNSIRLNLFEYIPTLTSDNTVALTPLMQSIEASPSTAYVAIGAAAPYVANLDPDYIRHAVLGPGGPEQTARLLVDEAVSHILNGAGPAQVYTFKSRSSRARVPRDLQTGRPSVGTNTLTVPPVDTKDVAAVHRFVHQKLHSIFPQGQFPLFDTVFHDVERFYRGGDPTYAAIDAQYHDLEHTLQATVCLTQLLAGRHAARVAPRVDGRHFELALVAALLHDTGYLRLRSDTEGTGAKYTFCHVLRSCAFAASYLPSVGANSGDIETILSAINCTGPLNEISRLRFQAPVDEIIGCAVATADYLGQMAAPDYPNKLGILFEEFRESDEYLHTSFAHRQFKSAHDLMARTPQFWHRYVIPKLDAEFHGVYRFLSQPLPTGRNLYIDAIEANMAEIQRRMAAHTHFNTGPISSKPTDRNAAPPMPAIENPESSAPDVFLRQ